MSTRHQELSIRTSKKLESVDVSDLVSRVVEESGIAEGVCVLFVPHTTAAITANEHFDPNVARDILKALGRAVPDEEQWDHPEDNAPAHVKATLTGPSLTVPVSGGKLALGQWQGLYFMEYDGPRTRRLSVTIIS
jgi:secondary thiamine-phosphate synthase enzyme